MRILILVLCLAVSAACHRTSFYFSHFGQDSSNSTIEEMNDYGETLGSFGSSFNSSSLYKGANKLNNKIHDPGCVGFPCSNEEVFFDVDYSR